MFEHNEVAEVVMPPRGAIGAANGIVARKKHGSIRRGQDRTAKRQKKFDPVMRFPRAACRTGKPVTGVNDDAERVGERRFADGVNDGEGEGEGEKRREGEGVRVGVLEGAGVASLTGEGVKRSVGEGVRRGRGEAVGRGEGVWGVQAVRRSREKRRKGAKEKG
jgi:hypothetical protein